MPSVILPETEADWILRRQLNDTPRLDLEALSLEQCVEIDADLNDECEAA